MSSFHNRVTVKGEYGRFSKVLEEVDEACEALEQDNKIMHLIELTDIIGAVEGVLNGMGFSLEDAMAFSNKVKESKEEENNKSRYIKTSSSIEGRSTQAKIERILVNELVRRIESNTDFVEVTVPSNVGKRILDIQNIPDNKRVELVGGRYLTGSAEQGILEMIKEEYSGGNYSFWAYNQCFRVEEEYDTNHLPEFRKLEFFSIGTEDYVRESANIVADLVSNLYNQLRINFRTEDVTDNLGIALKCTDIVATDVNGQQLELNSMLYFGNNHTSKLGLDKSIHTMCATGLAFPRILRCIDEETIESILERGYI